MVGWTRAELERMAAGELVDRNGKRYGLCRACGQIVRLDKPIVGSFHFCTADDEQVETDA